MDTPSPSVGPDPTRRFPGKFPEFEFLTHSQISSRISGNLEQGQLIPPNGLAGKTWGVICVFVTRDGTAMYVKGVKGTDFEKAWKNSAFDVGYYGGVVLDAMRACRKPEAYLPRD